jgi:HlyD family type I secretion membrane fusion protein
MKLAIPGTSLVVSTAGTWPLVPADAEAIPQPRPGDPARLVRAGLTIILGFFGLLGGWAAVSPIESAAVSYGVVGTEGSRKVVQHLDGGVVRGLFVKEGELVKEGQELIRLDQVQPRAALDIYGSAVRTLVVQIVRLEAEAARANGIKFPAAILARRSDPQVQDLIRSQEQIFTARRTAIAAQMQTLQTQIDQAKSQSAIYRGQYETAGQQYRMINEELAPKQLLYDKGYGTNSPVMQLKRAAATILGQQQEYKGNIERLEHSMAQLGSQMAQIQSDYLLKVAQELEDARNKLADAKERERVAQDVYDRTVIRAPARGNVLGLAVNTIGGVIGKGDKLLEIVPDNAAPIIKGRLTSAEGIEVRPGMKAELRIQSSEGRKRDAIRGIVRTRSADARSDPATMVAYYDIDVEVAAEDLDTVRDMKLLPGTPIEIIIPTGSRTVLGYLFDPISAAMRHGMREK